METLLPASGISITDRQLTESTFLSNLRLLKNKSRVERASPQQVIQEVHRCAKRAATMRIRRSHEQNSRIAFGFYRGLYVQRMVMVR